MDHENKATSLHVKSMEEETSHILQENARNITTAIQQAGEKLINQIDFNQEKNEYTVTVSVTLFDTSNAQFDCELQMVLFSVKLINGGIGKYEFGIVLAPKDKLRTSLYLHSAYDFELLDEIAYRGWKILFEGSSKKLKIISKMETNKTYQGMGVGSSLLFGGEEVAERLARNVAVISEVDFIEFNISDGSDSGWTTRQMQKMPGYMYNSSRSDDINYWIKLLNKPF